MHDVFMQDYSQSALPSRQSESFFIDTSTKNNIFCKFLFLYSSNYKNSCVLTQCINVITMYYKNSNCLTLYSMVPA